jgi:hypothetical protein
VYEYVVYDQVVYEGGHVHMRNHLHLVMVVERLWWVGEVMVLELRERERDALRWSVRYFVECEFVRMGIHLQRYSRAVINQCA